MGCYSVGKKSSHRWDGGYSRTLKLDFIVMHTSEIRWYVLGTYEYDPPEGHLHNRMNG